MSEINEHNNINIYLGYDNFKNLVNGLTEKFENNQSKTTVYICIKDIGFHNMLKIIEEALSDKKCKDFERSITIDGIDISLQDYQD